jgi:hypothetical protein
LDAAKPLQYRADPARLGADETLGGKREPAGLVRADVVRHAAVSVVTLRP